MTARSSCPPSSRSLPAAPSSIPKSSRVSCTQNARPHPSLAKLTPREQEVLGEIAQGKSNTAIAKSLVLTTRAVEKHIHSIFFKLGLAEMEGVSKRVKAVLLLLADETSDLGGGQPAAG